MIQLEYTKNYEKGLKKLKKKYQKEDEQLKKILDAIKVSNSVAEFISTPIAILYKYEVLKHELHGYHSLNLQKNGGRIRFIFRFTENNILFLEFISFDHYEDFKRILKGG